MNGRSTYPGIVLLALSAALLNFSAAHAQEPKAGKLKVSVSPPEAYTFVDGKAIGPGSRSMRLSEGQHSVVIANYGYQFFRQDVSITPGQTLAVKADLKPDGSKVSGPWGRIQLEVGTLIRGDYAVLLNGQKPDYFVGHVDEFNHNIIWKQELIVPVGTHQVTVTRNGKVTWSGPVTVAANKRVIVDISNGKQRVKDWPRGAQLASMGRFKAGTASASVAIAPVSGTISANPTKIRCNEPSQLKWASLETVDSDITGMSPVPTSGERSVSPKKSTNYEFTSTGPGGMVKADTTVEVDPSIDAQLQTSSPEAKYQKVGEKVITQEATTLTWSTAHSNAVSLDPFGSVAPEGSRTLQLTPAQTADGPVDETVRYNLRATNECGGLETKTVAVHLTGSIAPAPTVSLNSIFFPTAYPEKDDPTVGLLQSQKQALSALAASFSKYLEYNPDARILVNAYADERGQTEYNQALADRRAQSAKDYLVAQGVPMDKVDIASHGKEQPLDKNSVEQLQTTNPNPPPESHTKNPDASWLAYNRRVDVTILPTNEESPRYYPNTASDLELLWQREKPNRSSIQQDQ